MPIAASASASAAKRPMQLHRYAAPGQRMVEAFIQRRDIEHRLVRIDRADRLPQRLDEAAWRNSRAHGKPAPRIRPRTEVEVERLLADVGGEIAMTHGADHADDRVDVGVARRTEIKRASDRIAVREVLLREELVDDHVARARVPVRTRESATLSHRNAHRREVTFVDAPQKRMELHAFVLAADDAEHLAGVRAGKRQRRRESRRRDAGQAAHLVEHAFEHARLCRFVVILGVGQRDRRGEYVLARKPGSCCRILPKLRSRRPALASSATASASCVTTSALRVSRAPRPPLASRPLSRSMLPCAFARGRDRIGSVPNSAPASSERTNALASIDDADAHRPSPARVPMPRRGGRRPPQAQDRVRRRSMRAASLRREAAVRCARGLRRAPIARPAPSVARTSARASGWRRSRRRSAARVRRRTGSAAARHA